MRQPRHASTLASQALTVTDPANQFDPEKGAVARAQPSRFGFMFPELQTKKDLLPEGPETLRALVKLGKTMIDTETGNKTFDSTIPSIYTYFGQFIVHDLTFDSKPLRLFEEDVESLKPFSREEIDAIENRRSGLLNLESVYGPMFDDNKSCPVPRAGDKMRVEIAANGQVPGTDLPRAVLPPHKAQIADHRNDRNLLISQLHLAFLNAHNVVVNDHASYDEAQILLRRRYQQLVINDFLPRVVNAKDIQWASKNRIFNPPWKKFFIPVEFSAAAFRFGHAMVRSTYFYNAVRKMVRLPDLEMPEALSGYHHLITDWLVDWTPFLSDGVNLARNLAPRVVEPIAEFLDHSSPAPTNGGPPKRPILSLSVIDLLRGYLFRLPTGQAVARRLGVTPMTDDQLIEVAAAVSTEQAAVLKETGLLQHTPLWYYVLAEAAHSQHGNGNRLGPIGGRLVASVLLEAAARSRAALPKEEGWDPILGKQNNFNLGELLRHAKVSAPQKKASENARTRALGFATPNIKKGEPSMTIDDNIKEVRDKIRKERIEKQNNPAATTPFSDEVQSKATRAILGGPADYVTYMKLFAKTDAELARLIPTDGTTDEPRQRARAYLVRNGMCGHGTGELLLDNVAGQL
jgi:hypothetical protein